MRIAICTRLRIPIFICNRANSSSFASCGMRQLCADAEDVALVWQNEHRHAVKTTESGHKRSSTHRGKENLVAHHDLSLEVWSSKTFCTSSLIGHIFSNLYPSTRNTHSSFGSKHSHKHAGEMSLRHILRGWWQTFSWSTTQYEEEDIQYRSWEERRAGESRIHPDVSQWPQQHHRTEISHRSRAPSTPTIDIH